MAEHTNISWADHTFNPWIGCMKVSPACDACYAENLMDTRFGRVAWGAPGAGPGTRTRTSESTWKSVSRWNKAAWFERMAGHPPRFVFGGSLCDVFDNQAPATWRADYFRLIRSCPNLVFLLLTKRPANITDMSIEAGGLPGNAALGTTAENQEQWNRNVGHLCAAKARLDPAFTFVSAEPLIGPISPAETPVVREMRQGFAFGTRGYDRFDPCHPAQDRRFRLDWIITGGETHQGKHRARTLNLDWVRSLRDYAEARGVPFHHKQNGSLIGGRDLDGAIHDARPEVTLHAL